VEHGGNYDSFRGKKTDADLGMHYLGHCVVEIGFIRLKRMLL